MAKNKYKEIIVATLISLIVVTSAFAAFGGRQDRARQRLGPGQRGLNRHFAEPPMPAMRPEQPRQGIPNLGVNQQIPLDRILRQLDLTDEQAEKIKEVLQTSREQIQALRETVRELQQKIQQQRSEARQGQRADIPEFGRQGQQRRNRANIPGQMQTPGRPAGRYGRSMGMGRGMGLWNDEPQGRGNRDRFGQLQTPGRDGRSMGLWNDEPQGRGNRDRPGQMQTPGRYGRGNPPAGRIERNEDEVMSIEETGASFERERN